MITTTKPYHTKNPRLAKARIEAWRRYVEEPVPQPEPSGYRHPDTFKTLTAHNEFMTGTATFQRKSGLWRCISVSKELSWLRDIPFDGIKLELLRRGFEWEWS